MLAPAPHQSRGLLRNWRFMAAMAVNLVVWVGLAVGGVALFNHLSGGH